MDRPVLFNKKGVTLIEMMVALTILLIVSLALMQTAMLGMSTNVKNALRDEAVSIVERRMNELRSLAFTDSGLTATAGTLETGITRAFRGFSVTFFPTRTITDINPDTKQITITVTWDYRGATYHHGATSILMGKQ